MLKNLSKRKDGFDGQRAIIIPKKVQAQSCCNNAIISDLYVTDIGYYPRAKYHYRKRIHGADQHIFIYCVEGKGEVTIDKSSVTIEPGDFFIVPKNVNHVYHTIENNPWTIYWIHFTGKKADAFTQYFYKQFNCPKKNIGHSENRIKLFNTIYEQLERGYSIENIISSNLCLGHFLGTLLQPEHQFSRNVSQQPDVINQVIDFMKRNIHSMCTLQQMAKEVNISPPHLSAIFKHKTGFPPIEYFNHLKVQKACQFLMFTTLRINEIGSQIGIDDPYYFSRFFKKRIGESPHNYRAKYKEMEKKE